MLSARPAPVDDSTGPARHRRPARWAAVSAAVVLGVGGVTAAAVAAADPADADAAVTVRSADGTLIGRLPLEGDTFAVSYRNSVYTTLAEERYRVLADGRFELVGLAADQVAVLEEYYAVPGAPRPAPAGDRRSWVADPAPVQTAVFDSLRIAATDLGERTVHVPGSPPLAVWQRVASADPTVVLDIEGKP